ncbi:lipid-A-disaccharide synthase [bacterium]|nr:MAG: lipid-A-disaccharide synthase [bacterium]
MAQKNILIICGEASGDLQASSLVSAVKDINPDIKFFAVGGELLKKSGAEVFYDIKELSVIGLFDVLKKLPKFLSLKKIVLDKIKTLNPDAVIFVDFSGFNLRIAKEIKKSIRTIYYVSPQVWASRPGRIKTIKEYIHQMIVLFKFEEEFYKNHGITAQFVGHPLLDIVKPTMKKTELFQKIGFTENDPVIALLPGSRNAEIKNILPAMLSACSIIQKDFSKLQIVIAKSTQIDWEVYNRLLSKSKIKARIVEGKTYDCLNIADFSLVASGTATLEAAIMQKPFAVIYKMNPLNYFLYRPMIKIPYIGMVNIVAGKMIVPEFIQFRAKPALIAEEAVKTLRDTSKSKEIKEELAKIKTLLGEKGAASRAAKIINSLIV